MKESAYKKRALARGNDWECAVCGHVCHASALVWDDPYIPSCPACYTMDVMGEMQRPRERELATKK